MGRNRDVPKKPEHKPKLSDEERHKRFVEVARQVEADETEEGADLALKKVLEKKPIERPH
jgi:hypothetical protein